MGQKVSCCQQVVMEDSSLCSLTRKMECPGLLSKGYLNPFTLSVVGGLCKALLWQNLIWGGHNRWATTSSNAWATSFNFSSKARNSVKMSTFGDLQKKRGKLLGSLVFSSVLLLVYISCILLFCICFVCGVTNPVF